MNKVSNEIKVGLLVFASLILLGVLVFGVGEIHIFERGNAYNVIFDTTAALMKGAQVRMGGVPVGSVSDIGFIEHQGRRRVLVTVRVRKDITLHEKDQFTITMLGLLGDNYVEILPGPSDAPAVKPGATVVGADVIGMDEMFKMVERGLGSLNELLDDQTIASLKVTVKNSETMSTDLAYILNDSRENITATLDNLRSSSERLDVMLARNEQNFDVTMDNLTVMSGDARVAASSMRNIAESLDRGEGTAGKLLKDDQLYDELLTTTTEAKGLVTDIKQRPARYIHLSIF